MKNKLKINEKYDSLLNEIIIKMNSEFLRPIICIEYDRIPYIYKLSDVRITLDYNIRYSNDISNLFNSEKRFYYIDDKVLEIKYNEFLFSFIRNKICLNHLNISTFSKYKICLDDLYRRF